ncbi:hypothetical protein [Streptomyces coelicoflavus]|uniref:hypothetical protein n=1 Tax=Streptomyces coelicoflavus TaxID=285562 RepID=UPI001EF23B1E|nr:hypothetical protein [Streptomyces coelicoflavus]
MKRVLTSRSLPRPVIGGPFRILLLGCSFALAGYAGVRLLAGDWLGVALWFVGSALLHDLVLLPLYAVVDRAVTAGLDAAHHRAWTAYVRFPAAFSGLLLLVWFPLIGGRVDASYAGVTGLSADGFLTRWLLVTAALFGGSALLLALRLLVLRLLRSATKRRSPDVH